MSKSILHFCVFFITLTLQGQETIGMIERLDPAIDKFISDNAQIEVLASGFSWAEGPVWVSHLNGILFTDVPKNTAYFCDYW